MSSALVAPARRELFAAGLSDVGRARDVNEDRFHADPARGIVLVIDGVGGQAAGGRAADTALAIIRDHLERANGSVPERIREAVTAANNEIHRLAALRPEWNGMACVLTVAVVEDGQAIVGHVGDTRLYRLLGDGIDKVTPDHSPVGEREDAGDLSEQEAMRHPRRNEVYRDVGSDRHEAHDAEFVDVRAFAFTPETALLLCSDGLTDLVPLDTIREIVGRRAGRPQEVVQALVTAANEAGGKDNITVVYVEGAAYAASRSGALAAATTAPPPGLATRRRGVAGPGVRTLAGVLMVICTALLAWTIDGKTVRESVGQVLDPLPANVLHVRANESIAAAISRAPAGSAVVVAPGEYQERLTLKDNVRVVSRVPRGAVLRLPPTASESEAAVIAAGVTGAELAGFRIVGDAMTPLGIGVLTRDAMVRLVDLDISGATRTAVDLGAGDDTVLMGSELHDNPGGLLTVRAGATPRVAHSTLSRSARSEPGARVVVIEAGANPQFVRNVFIGVGLPLLTPHSAESRAAIAAANWFLTDTAATPARAVGRGRQGR
jgi:serine/threonine protein phosphatase PrpC